jgi:hypothetical protein
MVMISRFERYVQLTLVVMGVDAIGVKRNSKLETFKVRSL